MKCLFVLAVLLIGASAHNWLNNPSRCPGLASVTQPCMERINPEPHVQIGPNQSFPVEWSVGHGDSRQKTFYFVILHTKDYDRIDAQFPRLTAMIEAYLAQSPVSARVSGGQFEKRHLSNSAITGLSSTANTNQVNLSTVFDRYLDPVADADLFIPRYASLGSRSKRNTVAWKQARYPSAGRTQDLGAVYYNAAYPWIEAAYRFHNPIPVMTPFAGEYDTAMLRFDARQGPGSYIAHFLWSGYRDCMDIDVQPNATANPWGTKLANQLTRDFVKLDHCELTFMKNPLVSCAVAPNNDAASCLSACRTMGGCQGVNMVRASNPPGTLPFTVNIPNMSWSQVVPVGYPFDPDFLARTGPCDYFTVAERVQAGCPNVNPMCDLSKLSYNSSSYICYGVRFFIPPDVQATQAYTVSNDPLDPKFYSTCWLPILLGQFSNYSTSPVPAPVWSTGDSCVSCAFLTNSTKLPKSVAPNWMQAFTTSCRNCDNLQY